MNRIITFLILVLVALHANAVRVTFDYRVFDAPGKGPYVEFYTSFDGRTLTDIPADSGLFQSKAELTIMLIRNGKIADFTKELVESATYHKGESSDFMSVSRIFVPTGIYNMEVEILDLGNPTAEVTKYTQEIAINNPSSGPFISDIEFLSAYRPAATQTHFTKVGYDMMPFNSDFYPETLKSLIFYAEIYRTDQAFGMDSAFVSKVSVIDDKGVPVESCQRIKREKAAPVVSVLQTFDLSQLVSGTYTIRIEIRDKKNNSVYLKDRTFTRQQQITHAEHAIQVTDEMVALSFAAGFTDKDELYQHILYHLPIAGDLDRVMIDNVLKGADLKTMQSFLYSFWLKRNADNPTEEWAKYNESIKIVKQNFATKTKPGWQTDRGRVYLQYGKPNTRVVRPSESGYWPFEIWHYYVTDSNLHNRRFLFYDTNLSGDMELLHSDVPGETKNYFWKDMVKSRPAALNMGDASAKNAAQRTDPNSRDLVEDLWYNPH